MFPEITVEELSAKLKTDDKFILLDVREHVELTRAKIDDPRLEIVPTSQMGQKGAESISETARSGSVPVYIICHHGNRSMQVTGWLVSQGFKNIFNVSGGIHEYARKVDPSVGVY